MSAFPAVSSADPSRRIGGAAQTATHAAVFAQLYIKGVCYGTKTFITPLRNPKTFALLPGVSIGDIGKKMGRDGIDNGWMYASPRAQAGPC